MMLVPLYVREKRKGFRGPRSSFLWGSVSQGGEGGGWAATKSTVS